MNYKKVSYILLSISFVLIIAGGFSSFIVSLQKDYQQTQKRVGDVLDIFEAFSSKITTFESLREELYTSVLNNIYYESLDTTDEIVKQKLLNYEKLVDEIDLEVKKLDNLCNNIYYNDSNTNKQCYNYKAIYEQVINYFITDIKVYNKHVDKYNIYQKQINSNLEITKYKTKKKYIDYNNDGKYDGKEE